MEFITSDALTPEQWCTLFAITSAIVPELSAGEIETHAALPLPKGAIEKFARLAASAENELFRQMMELVFDKYLPQTSKDGIKLVLDMLNSRIGCLGLTYSLGPFSQQHPAERERILKMWTDPYGSNLFPPIRRFAASMMALTKNIWLRSGESVIRPALAYDGILSLRMKSPEEWIGDAAKGEEKGYYDKYKFLQPELTADQEVVQLKTDVLIVGSGCGGAVSAKVCAEAGLKVLVVEKGTWIKPENFPLTEDEAGKQLYENGGFCSAVTGGISLLAGSTFGGGGVINWAASLQTQGYVRRQWAEEHSLPFFLTSTFQRHLDSVCARMGVEHTAHHNHRNNTLFEGGHKLGLNIVSVPQNAPPLHQDGYCQTGCGFPPGQRKMGTTHTWLPDASRAGAEFMTEFHADRILFDGDVAIGAEGTYLPTATPVRISAKSVIVSAGTIHTPAVLLRSGLKNPHIGANLHLHPAVMASGVFPYATHPERGSPLTSAITDLQDLDNHGHGVKLEASFMAPVLSSVSLAWQGGKEWKQAVSEFARTATFFALCREKNTGSINLGPTSKAVINYSLHKEEREWLIRGLEELVKILYIEGAEKIYTPIIGFPPFTRGKTKPDLDLQGQNAFVHAVEVEVDEPGVLDADFNAWLARLKELGLPRIGCLFGSAHQMGTARMGAAAAKGVVDTHGRVYGKKGLWVADASIMPSASGVNPMITVMALAEWIAKGVVDTMKRGE